MKILTIILLIFIINVQGEDTDTLICRQKVIVFYDWYKKVITREIDDVFLPRFIENNDGFTALDFTEYGNNLKRFGFTDELINREIESYQSCTANLQKIEYQKFKEFDDLSNYEDIGCDFFNTHRWIKSMESFSGVEIIKSTFEIDSCKIYGRIYEEYGSNDKFYYRSIIVSLIKTNGIWMIDNIEI